MLWFIGQSPRELPLDDRAALVPWTLDRDTGVRLAFPSIANFTCTALRIITGVIDTAVINTYFALTRTAYRTATCINADSINAGFSGGTSDFGTTKNTFTVTTKAVLSAIDAVTGV